MGCWNKFDPDSVRHLPELPHPHDRGFVVKISYFQSNTVNSSFEDMASQCTCCKVKDTCVDHFFCFVKLFSHGLIEYFDPTIVSPRDV